MSAQMQQQNLGFLSVNGHTILNEIFQDVPTLLMVSYLRARRKHLWTEKNGGDVMINKLATIVYKHLFELTLRIIDEVRALSTENYERVVNYVYGKADESRTNFKFLAQFDKNFFRKMFEHCAVTQKARQQEKRKMPPSRCNQPSQNGQQPRQSHQVPMVSNTIPHNQCGVQQMNNKNQYQTTSTAVQSSLVQSGPSYVSFNQTGPSVSCVSQNALPINNNNAYFNGPTQTNTYHLTQPAAPIWQMNGNNEMLTYQPQQMQPQQVQTVSVVSMQSPSQPHVIQQTTNAIPQFQMQVGVCQQATTLPYVIQNTAGINQMTFAGQAFNSCNGFVGSVPNPSAIQTQSTLPILQSMDVAQVLQQTVQTQTDNAPTISDSNNSNGNHHNANHTIRIGDVYKINTNTVHTNNQSNLNNNRCVQTAPVPPSNVSHSNNDRKRLASSMQNESAIEARPLTKHISISSNKATGLITNGNNVQPNAYSMPRNTRNAAMTNVGVSTNQIPCKMSAVPVTSPVAVNERLADSTKSQITSQKMHEPSTSKAFINDAVDKQQSENIESQTGNCEEAVDFEILVETFTGTTREIIEKCKVSAPDEYDPIVDLCEDSGDTDSDIGVVNTINEHLSQPQACVSLLSK